jgi:hypothetical protein
MKKFVHIVPVSLAVSCTQCSFHCATKVAAIASWEPIARILSQHITVFAALLYALVVLKLLHLSDLSTRLSTRLAYIFIYLHTP